MAMGEDCESQHLAAKKGAVQKLPEARWRDQAQHTAGKWRHCESYFGASTRELAAWAGHELGG